MLVDSTPSNTLASKHPVRRVHKISNRMVIVLEPNLLKHLNISEEDSFEQVLQHGGILLKPVSKSGDFSGVAE
jgi:hypothetical protein